MTSVLERDVALFAIAFQTERRGGDLEDALVAGVLKFPRSEVILLNFVVGEMLCAGGARAVPVRPDLFLPSSCPVAVMQLYIESIEPCQNSEPGYPFRDIDSTQSIAVDKVQPEALSSWRVGYVLAMQQLGLLPRAKECVRFALVRLFQNRYCVGAPSLTSYKASSKNRDSCPGDVWAWGPPDIIRVATGNLEPK